MSTASTRFTGRDRSLVLAAAFTGWMFAGFVMGIFPLIGRPATIDLLQLDMLKSGHTAAAAMPEARQAAEKTVGRWYAWYTTAFLLGAATGGLVFGWIGDRLGRVRSMALSILCYSLVTGLTYFAPSVESLLVLRFVASMGIGGMWPTGVALCHEAWPDVSRPMLAGLIGTAANVGITVTGVLSQQIDITPQQWRWLLVVGAAPAALGLILVPLVPESPGWLASQADWRATGRRATPVRDVFRPPLLWRTLLGIVLGAIPLVGGWAAATWLIPWADKMAAPGFKGSVVMARSGGAVVGALFGGYLANLLGRRTTYFAISLASLAVSAYLFRFLSPADGFEFLFWTGMLGLISTVFFGWLPLYLPELFPTHARSTGSGVTFNFGRILTALCVLASGELFRLFQSDYGRVGAVTSLIYAAGMVVIFLAPDTTRQRAA